MSRGGEVRALRTTRRSLVLLLLLASAACRAEPAPADEQDRAEVASIPGTAWRSVGEWSGRGERQTSSFDVTTGGLRLTWEAREEDGQPGGRLRVTLHSAISGRPLQALVDVQAPGADTVLFAANPRVAYLLIESAGLHWRVALEEGQQGAYE